SRAAVELRGWVKDRGSRTLAARIARAVPGIDNVINSILVRGEDDSFPGGKRVTDQSA
ncbi:MAG: BON domain-containing protein, partial [Gemmatimonadales bacterium]